MTVGSTSVGHAGELHPRVIQAFGLPPRTCAMELDLSAVFTVSYLAFSLPAIAAGLAIGPLGLTTTAEVYGAVVVALALTAVAGLARDRRPVPVTGG